MEDVWKRIIKDQSTVRYEQADFFSPYCESVTGSIKGLSDGSDLIQLNTFYRYDDIFLSLFERTDISEENRKWMLDCMMHLLTRLELRNGVYNEEYLLRTKWHEISAECYGNRLKVLFEKLNDDRRYMASWYLIQQERNGESIALFAKALIGMLGDGVLYRSEENTGELVLYMGKEENDQEKDVMEFAKEAYLPFGCQIRVFWNSIFGIVSDERCMKIGSIEVY